MASPGGNTPYTFNLTDQSGLDSSDYSLRVLGFSVASNLLLLPEGTSSLGWAPLPDGATVQASVVQGSATVTLASLPPFTDIILGDQVTGDGIPAGATVTGISMAVTLSNSLTAAVAGSVEVVAMTMVGGTATQGSNTITGLVPPPSVSGLRVGQVVSGQGIPAGATVAQVGPGAQVMLTQPATAGAVYTGTNPLLFSLSLQGSGAAGGTSLTLSAVTSAAQVAVNALISGGGIPANTTITGIGSLQITLSVPATSGGSAVALGFTQAQSCTLTAGGNAVSGLGSTAGLGVGFPVQGTGIPGGTTIAAVASATSIVLSNSASAGGTSLIFPRATGVVPSFDISQYDTFVFDPTVQTAGLNGARVYLFVVPKSWPAVATQSGFAGYPTNPPGFPYAWSATGFGVMQANTPPNTPDTTSSYPPFSIVEPTIDALGAGGGLHIDVQTVDGFTFALTLNLADANGNQLGQVGQPVPAQGVNRVAIIAAFQAAFPSGNPYAPLLYGGPNDIDGQYPGILNPGAYLAAGANAGSALATMWTAALTTLYTGSTLLNMIGDDSNYYQGIPQVVSGSNVLQFTGYSDAKMTQTNGNVFNLYSPLTPDPPNAGLGAGFQVFANAGVYADSSAYVLVQTNTNPNVSPAKVALGLQRDLVSALNRGIALTGPSGTAGRTAGDTSAYWGMEGNWYPAAMSDSSAPQNQFSLFMHTAQVSGVLVFTSPGGTPAAIAASPNGATVSGTTVTITTTGAHGLATNNWVAIQNVACAGYNGTFQVTGAPTSTTFTYTVPSGIASTLTPSGSGSATGGAAATPQGALMGQAYGFAYDESPVHSASGQPNVPSKYDPAPAGTATVDIVFGPWGTAAT
ncbi:MAG: hypothetical protein JST22_15245 [Bacteroidetes bacterium]|nr:hypothetical protein [Bacteroidota bacterium]